MSEANFFDRKPDDGHPYYCKLCGAGLDEYFACELPDCELESIEDAQERADTKKPGEPG